MNGISFGKAKLTDALRLSILLKVVYIQVYGVDGVTIEFANFITKKFAPNEIERKIIKEPDSLWVAYTNGNPIGIAEILFCSRCPIRKTEVAELGKLYVLEHFHGKGVGLALLNRVQNHIINKGFAELNLEVYIQNERAITFYKKLGFRILGEVDFLMEHNTYRNLVMNKSLNYSE